MKFIGQHDGQQNLYYSVNQPKTALNKKAEKADVGLIHFLHADIDPEVAETPEEFKRRALKRIRDYGREPTEIVNSGNGLQVLYRLDPPIGPEFVKEVEIRNQALAKALGAKPGTHDISRVLRLPGTTNIPTKRKRRDGRDRCLAFSIEFTSADYRLEDFPPHSTDDLSSLPHELALLITQGAEEPNRSDKFHYVVRSLQEREYSVRRIHDLLVKYPNGIASKYLSRLEQEIGRSYSKQQSPTKSNVLIQSSAEFIKDFVPPDYLVDGILQQRFIYSITGHTGMGKTCLALLTAAHVSDGRSIHGKQVKQGRVLYFAGENPDDIRMRWIALTNLFDFDASGVYFIPGAFKLCELETRIKQEAERLGEFALVIVDTSVVYFDGDDENSNTQLGTYARRLRNLTPLVPGRPAVLACCHPPKNAGNDGLLPRGGGAFLNEMDGNLTCFKDDNDIVRIHWLGKFRGPDFAPLLFKLTCTTHVKLRDSSGKQIPTVVATPLSDEDQQELAKASRTDEDQVLQVLAVDGNQSLTELAAKLRWLMKSGEPYKMRVSRVIDRLKKQKLIKPDRDGYLLTEQGKKLFNNLA